MTRHIVLMGVVSVFALVMGCREDDPMTEDQIREAIQVGTDRKVVEAFLGDHQIEYSILEGEALSLEPDLAGSPYPVVSRYVARVPNVRRRMLVYKESILIRIDVGSHGSVLDVKVERAATGP